MKLYHFCLFNNSGSLNRHVHKLRECNSSWKIPAPASLLHITNLKTRHVDRVLIKAWSYTNDTKWVLTSNHFYIKVQININQLTIWMVSDKVATCIDTATENNAKEATDVIITYALKCCCETRQKIGTTPSLRQISSFPNDFGYNTNAIMFIAVSWGMANGLSHLGDSLLPA